MSYRVNADITPHLENEAGLAVRSSRSETALRHCSPKRLSIGASIPPISSRLTSLAAISVAPSVRLRSTLKMTIAIFLMMALLRSLSLAARFHPTRLSS
jgi:hypothetical protein